MNSLPQCEWMISIENRNGYRRTLQKICSIGVPRGRRQKYTGSQILFLYCARRLKLIWSAIFNPGRAQTEPIGSVKSTSLWNDCCCLRICRRSGRRCNYAEVGAEIARQTSLSEPENTAKLVLEAKENLIALSKDAPADIKNANRRCDSEDRSRRRWWVVASSHVPNKSALVDANRLSPHGVGSNVQCHGSSGTLSGPVKYGLGRTASARRSAQPLVRQCLALDAPASFAPPRLCTWKSIAWPGASPTRFLSVCQNIVLDIDICLMRSSQDGRIGLRQCVGMRRTGDIVRRFGISLSSCSRSRPLPRASSTDPLRSAACCSFC